MIRFMNTGPEWAVEVLRAQHPEIPRVQVEAMVHEVHQELSANSWVTTHLTALTLNRCHRRLRELDDRSGRLSLRTVPAA
jgi:hypothetical protein